MPVITSNESEQLSERLNDKEGLVHTHYSSGFRAAVTLFEEEGLDEDYEGEPYECPFGVCDFSADYAGVWKGFSYHYEPHRDVYVCDVDGCGYDHEKEQIVKSHITSEHVEEEEEPEEVEPEDLGITGSGEEEEEEEEYNYSYNEDTGEYECGDCDYTTESDEGETRGIRSHYSQKHGD